MSASEAEPRNPAVGKPSPFFSAGNPSMTPILPEYGSRHLSDASRLNAKKLASCTGVLNSSNSLFLPPPSINPSLDDSAPSGGAIGSDLPNELPKSTSSNKSERRRRRKKQDKSGNAPATAAGSGTSDQDMNQSGWCMEVKPPERKKQRRVTYFGKLTPEKRHEVLMNNPKVARKATPQFLIDHDDDDIASFIRPLIGSKESRIVTKFTQVPSEDEISRMFSRFQVSIAPVLNRVMGSFLDHTFSNPDQAACALSLVIRSYVSGFTVHKKTEYRTKDGKVVKLQCHTRNNRPKSRLEKAGTEDTGESVSPVKVKSNCKWTAVIVNHGNYSSFTEICDFSVHTRECFRQYARFTPSEVSFQQSFPSCNRKSTMEELNQIPVRPGTLSQRTFRANAAEKAEIAEALRKEMSNYPVDATIYHSVDGCVEVNEEMLEILQYLSMLRAKEGLEAQVVFERSLAVTEVVSINLMWNAGKNLLSTHSDVIFCDSIWGVSDNIYNGLTIVVVDENNDVRLAAISLSKREEKVRWKAFFLWVKSVVPNFNPRCVISDGAAYIYNAFCEVMGSGAVHVTCWWHLRQNVKGQDGLDRVYGMRMLSLTYASSSQELQLKKDGLVAELKLKYSDPRRQVKVVERAAENALIKLKVFTGGTVTNSYAESINSRLRQFGLITVFNMFSVLQYLHSFVSSHNVRETPPLLLTDQMKEIFGDDVLETVTKGVLSVQKSFLSASACEVVSVDGDRVTVEETKSFEPENQKELRKKLQEQQAREGGQSREGRREENRLQKVILVKNAKWKVNWTGEKPKCSCNGLVYRGMPCPHIVLAARALKKKIPLECFNPRFYISSSAVNLVDVSPPSPPLHPSTQQEDEFRDEDQLLSSLSCDENSRLEFSQHLQSTRATKESSVLLKLTKLEEINLYKLLEENANLLVEIRAVPEYEDKANKVALEFKQMITAVEIAYNSVLQQTNGKALGPQLNDLQGSVLVVFADCGDASKSVRDDLHIARACLDMRNPSDAMCRFRGQLKALIIRLLLLHQQNYKSEFLVGQFIKSVKELARECRTNANTGDAGLSHVQGRATSQSYFLVPRMVDKHCISDFEDSRRQVAAVASECSSAATTTSMIIGDSDEESIS